MKTYLRALLAPLLMLLSVVLAAPSTAQAYTSPNIWVGSPATAASGSNVSIYTYCASASVKPVGMWYHASSGQQGWANWGAADSSQGAQWFTFHLDRLDDRVDLSIGCGGTPQTWGKVMSGAVAVFKTPSQGFTANCSEAGPYCRLTNR